MTTTNISLPEETKVFIEARIIQDGYASASEYLRALVRDEQEKRANLDLAAKIFEGLQGSAIIPDHEE